MRRVAINMTARERFTVAPLLLLALVGLVSAIFIVTQLRARWTEIAEISKSTTRLPSQQFSGRDESLANSTTRLPLPAKLEDWMKASKTLVVDELIGIEASAHPGTSLADIEIDNLSRLISVRLSVASYDDLHEYLRQLNASTHMLWQVRSVSSAMDGGGQALQAYVEAKTKPAP